MTRSYWFPCSCGRRFAVDPSQAGQTIDCPCGIRLDIPPLRRMVQLDKVPEDGGGDVNTGWGWQQRFLLLGGCLLIVAMAGATWIYWTWPSAPWLAVNSNAIHEEVVAMTPWQRQQLYWSLRAPLDPRIPTEWTLAYESAVRMQTGRLCLIGAIGLSGAASLIAGLIARIQNRSRFGAA